MPIRPENRHRYPDNWTTEIVPAILARAGSRCEGSPAYPDCRAERHQPHPRTKNHNVRLTVAHLDHTPENCTPENLRAWCEQCHNTYDREHRTQTRTETVRKRRIDAGQMAFALFPSMPDIARVSEANMDYELACMQAVLDTLTRMQPQAELFAGGEAPDVARP